MVSKTLEIVVEYCIKQEFDSYFFYLFESADSSPAEAAASRLVAYLDELLIELKAVRAGVALSGLINCAAVTDCAKPTQLNSFYFDL